MVQRKDFVCLNQRYFFWPETNHPLLGRICSDANEPKRNYFPSNPSAYHSKNAQAMEFTTNNVEMVLSSAQSTTARIALDRIFNLLRQKQRDRVSSWQAEKVRTFTLPQENEVLDNMIKDMPLLAKMNDWLADNDSLYMITGYMTMISAGFSEDESRTSSTEVEASLSRIVEAAAQATAGAPLRLPELVAALKNSSEISTSWKATYIEETVFAVKYRQIARKWTFLSWLQEGKIRLRNAQVPGANVFGPATADSDIQHWQAIKDQDEESTENEQE